MKPMWQEHDKFFNAAKNKTLFAKVVFDKNLAQDEIKMSSELAKKYDIELILQPKMDGNKLCVDSKFIQETLDKYLSRYKKVRLIPQTHKFLDIE